MRTELSQFSHGKSSAVVSVVETKTLTAPTQHLRQEGRKTLTQRNFVKPHPSITLHRASVSQVLPQCCNCKVKSRTGGFQYSNFSLRFRQQSKLTCPTHSRPYSQTGSVAKIEAYVKLGAVIVGFLCTRQLFVPSINVSLRAEFRTKNLPLESFFFNLYEMRLSKSVADDRAHVQRYGVARDEYLLSVIRKVLQEACSSGQLSPYQRDEMGQTLLHVSIH